MKSLAPRLRGLTFFYLGILELSFNTPYASKFRIGANLEARLRGFAKAIRVAGAEGHDLPRLTTNRFQYKRIMQVLMDHGLVA